jgi:hypothetical protein
MAEIGAGGPSRSSLGVSGSSRVKKIFLLFLVLFLVVGGVFFVLKQLGFFSGGGPTVAVPVEIVQNTPVHVPQTVADVNPESNAPYRSENFRVGDIALGGEASLMIPENNPSPLEIRSVRGEAFPDKTKNNSKLVITWETNKPAKSEISYGKGVGQAEGTITEDAFGLSHSVVVPDLAQASTYVYVISSKDQFGNTASSDPYAVYTGAREVSLFELIAGAVGEVFGWAVKK